MRGRCHARPEHPGFTAGQFNGMFAAAEKSTFKQTHDRGGVFFVEFTNAVVSGFTKVWMQDASLEVTREPVRFTIVSPGQTILPDGEPETLVAAE